MRLDLIPFHMASVRLSRKTTGSFLFAAAVLVIVLLYILRYIADHRAQLAGFDSFILQRVGEWRSSELTVVFVNLTAVGSLTVVALLSLIGAAFLMSIRARREAIQLFLIVGAAQGLTELAKNSIERPRPSAIPALVEAAGFSYPSGHALMTTAFYVTLALIVNRHIRSSSQRVILAVSVTVIVFAVALSRVYLGVHYPSDTVGGTLLGLGLALLLDKAVARFGNAPA